ncbi:DUF7504 family protein [Natronorubrum halophilum]|uniref:DUF7504 family protein n=1 Tax=Natronorubrum halophilum TaxID=1702106 RepID=UPI000EF677D6|nr:hypothetical protein [Natronorubrum halophilum]
MEPRIPAEIEPPANVLLVDANAREPNACTERCYETDSTAALTVSFVDDQLEQPDPDEVDGRVGLLTIGNDLLDERADSDPDFADSVVVDSVCDPTDLSEIGIAVSRFCEHWFDDGEQISVCFESLDALIRYRSPKEVFQFTRILLGRLESVDADAHVHFDPSRHEDRLVSAFGSVFDAVIVDENADRSLPEATDEEVEELLAAWSEASENGLGLEADPSTEATDEEIARILGNECNTTR